jgi:MFS family permease
MAMTEHGPLTRENLKSHRAAAIAGILFSIILILVFWLLRISVPDDPQEPGSWLKSESNSVALAVNLVPFAGIAFLWFIGVLGDRLGEREDKFFATVFFGSGLLFLAMLFAAAAVITLRTGEAKRRPNFSWEPAGTGPRPKRNCRNGLSLPKARLLCYLILRLCLAGARWHGPDNRQVD